MASDGECGLMNSTMTGDGAEVLCRPESSDVLQETSALVLPSSADQALSAAL